MIPFPGPNCFSRERDQETAPSKTEVETMARAGALSHRCMCACVWLVIFLCVFNHLTKQQKQLLSSFLFIYNSRIMFLLQEKKFRYKLIMLQY